MSEDNKVTYTTNDIEDGNEIQRQYEERMEKLNESYDEYLKELKKRQEKHLEEVEKNMNPYPFVDEYPINNPDPIPFIPCLHDSCQECHGTGVKKDGSSCIHMISCPCPKCTPYCMSTGV